MFPAVLLTLPPSKAADMAHLCVPQNQALGVCRRSVADVQVCGTRGREDLVSTTITSNSEEKEVHCIVCETFSCSCCCRCVCVCVCEFDFVSVKICVVLNCSLSFRIFLIGKVEYFLQCRFLFVFVYIAFRIINVCVLFVFVHIIFSIVNVHVQEATEEELEKLLDKIMVLFRFIHGR